MSNVGGMCVIFRSVNVDACCVVILLMVEHLCDVDGGFTSVWDDGGSICLELLGEVGDLCLGNYTGFESSGVY